MATRNERKRAAKLRKLELERAVEAAFAAEAERDAQRERFAAYPTETRHSPNRNLFDRCGIVQRGAFVSREPSVSPLVHDGNPSGRGQLRKRMI